jgi:hypothetical protein
VAVVFCPYHAPNGASVVRKIAAVPFILHCNRFCAKEWAKAHSYSIPIQHFVKGGPLNSLQLEEQKLLPKGLTVMPEYKVSSVPVVSINSMFSKNFAMSAPLLKCMSHPSGAK